MSQTEIEQVIDRLGRSPGHRLLTYREVGLPFWDVPLQCRVQVKKNAPVLSEFVLRCIESGLQTSDKIREFLGLPGVVVDATMAELLSSGHLVAHLNASNDELAYVLTSRGRELAVSLVELTPELRTISLSFDGLIRAYVEVPRDQRWRPRDLKENGIIEIPAFPADPPDVGPSMTSEVDGVLSGILQGQKPDLLSVLGLDGKREKFFVKAVAMVFQSIDQPHEIAVHFAVDGRRSETHEHAFAVAEGKRKLGIIDILQQDRLETTAFFPEQVLGLMADESDVDALRRLTETYKEQLEVLGDSGAADEMDFATTSKADSLAEKIYEAESALRRMPVRILEVQEHPNLLREALATATERLMIISPWIRTAVVDNQFMKMLEERLKAGVDVFIGYGIDDGNRDSSLDRAGIKRLRSLESKYTKFRMSRLGDTHAKVLINDSLYVVVSSFNWLSFKGDPERPFRDERGTLVSIKTEIDKIFDSYATRILEQNA